MPNSFNSGKILVGWSQEMVARMTAIYEYKGNEKLYQAQAPEILAALQANATIESTESSNRIEGVIASPERVREIVSRGAVPTTRPEAEIAGYRDVLGQIHAAHQHIALTPNIILQLHRDMFRYTGVPVGRWKPVENKIEATTPDGSAAFVLDFLCIHPFLDGNGRLARLLTTLLLYRGGFNVARYVGIERLVETTKPSYYESLRASSEKWHDGEHDLLPWLDYFLGIILAAYQQLDQKLGGGDMPSKAHRVRLAVELMPPVFSKAELAGLCPGISPSTLKRVLEDLHKQGRITAQRGKGALWRKM